ncbi:MAG: hypothetical protein ACHQ4H_13355, partial [Ktedonobacterales bacterium]
ASARAAAYARERNALKGQQTVKGKMRVPTQNGAVQAPLTAQQQATARQLESFNPADPIPFAVSHPSLAHLFGLNAYGPAPAQSAATSGTVLPAAAPTGPCSTAAIGGCGPSTIPFFPPSGGAPSFSPSFDPVWDPIQIPVFGWLSHRH